MEKKILKILDASTKIRNDVSVISFVFGSSEIIPFLSSLENEVKNNRVLQISKGSGSITLICDNPLGLRLLKQKKSKIINYKKNLSVITMISPKQAVDTPGILAHILTKFVKEKINVYEILSSHNEVSFVIDEKDAIKAREFLGKFF